jgi:aspartate racemase
MIGIVGGLGPYAGLDLMKKVFDNTIARSDQDHLDVVILSLPGSIADRTEYLEGKVEKNPGLAIAGVLKRLEDAGATHAGIPCNTAHAPGIINAVRQELEALGSSITLVNMIDETIRFLTERMPDIERVGVLSTTGEYRAGLYENALELAGKKAIKPGLQMQEELIHPAIYDPGFGIKTFSSPIHSQARENLIKGFTFLRDGGAELVILGCTEIPLAFPEAMIMGMKVMDPTWVLARALIRSVLPEKLISYEYK